jgi:flagellar hook-associated protein 2
MTTLGSVGTISSSGIGSGLDVEGIVTKLMAIEQRPLTLLQSAASGIQTKISAYGSLQSAESAFRDAARVLANPATWSATTGTSSDAGSVAVVT